MKPAAAMVLVSSLVVFGSTPAMSGPADPSSFDPVHYDVVAKHPELSMD